MRIGCPKRLVNGPCGGLRPDGGCEVDGRPCPFLELLEKRPESLEEPRLAPGFVERAVDPVIKPYSGFMEKITGGGKAVLAELEPSRRGVGYKLLEQAKPLVGVVDGFTLTDNPLGRVQADPIAAAAVLRMDGYKGDVLVHVSCKDRNRASLTSLVLGALWVGVNGFLALTGDWPGFMAGRHVKPVFDLDSPRLLYMLRLLRDHGVDYMGGKIKDVPGFNVAAALNPYTVWDVEVRRARAKRRAGAELFITQPVFSKDQVGRVEDLRSDPLLREVPVLGTVMLVRNEWDKGIVERHFGVSLDWSPGRVLDLLEESIETVLSSRAFNGVVVAFSGDWNYSSSIASLLRRLAGGG